MTMIEIAARSLPEWLRMTRHAAGLTLREMAPQVGVSHATVSAWERGQGEPTVTHFVRWCRATGQQPERMIGALAEWCAPWDSNPEPTD